MFKFSWSLLLSGIFIAYVLHSVYSIVLIFIPPKCTDNHCLRSYLESKPKLQLIIGTTHKSELRSWKELTLIEQWKSFDYSAESITKNLTIPLPTITKNNGTLHLYAFATPIPRSERTPWHDVVSGPHTMVAYFQLTEFLVPEAATFNLLNTEAEAEQKSVGDDKETETKEKKKIKEKPVVHIAKKLRLTVLTDPLVLPAKDLPPDFGMLIRLISSDTYLPPMRFDRFNSRIRDFYKINATEDSYQLEFEFTPASIGSIRMAAQFQAAMETMMNMGFSVKDLDEIKGIFADTNVYLLALTLTVASMHLLFDFLAFKNDVIYWKQRKTTVGLSSRTILWRCFSQMVVFLYLLEEKSSMLIIIPSGIGSVIEIWKVSKAFKATIVFENGLPRLRFGKFNESEKATAEHDGESMRYLSYLLYPLCLGGAVYSLLYTPHKSWYSWTVQSLVNGVYAFGFLFMLPQLFINYRLKSVAHLPWRAFMYKAFNTFIDDIFAFIITMPTAHRVACFRDDVVFLIYLYQRWLYPVDKSRIDSGGDVEYELESDEAKKNK